MALRYFLWSLVAAFVAIPGATFSGAAFGATDKFNGRWTMVLTTDVGKCEASIPAGFTIKSDDIAADAESALKADGAVEASGAMWVRFSAGDDQYRAQGRLSGATGSGVWSSGSRYCGGKWRATKAR